MKKKRTNFWKYKNKKPTVGAVGGTGGQNEQKIKPHDDIIIPSAGDSVKSLQDTIAGIARHKTLAEKIQYALADYYRRKEKWEKAHWLPQCGSWLQWRQYTDPNKTAVLTAANYCHHALCPICAWRRHAKYGAIFFEST